MLEINLLGRFEVHPDGKAAMLDSRPAQALLAYLVLQPGTAQPREKLAGVLWPDSAEENARANLRHALWRLRKAIGNKYLQIDKSQIAIVPGADVPLDYSASVLHCPRMMLVRVLKSDLSKILNGDTQLDSPRQ